MEDRYHVLWQQIAQTLAGTDAPPELTSLQKRALNILSKHAPEIYAGEVGLTMTEAESLALSQKFHHLLDAEKPAVFNFISRGIGWGNQHLGWDVPLLPFYHKIKRKKSHLQAETYNKKNPADKLVTAFWESLKTPQTPVQQLGQIAVSAILFGGLLQKRWCQPLMNAIAHHDFFQIKSWLWVELHHKATTDRPAEHKRWVADPLTQLLIYRYLRSGKTEKKGAKVWPAIEKTLRCLPLAQDDVPCSLTELLQMGRARHLYTLTPSLLGYATGDLPSSSLPIEAWLRIMSGKSIPVHSEDRMAGADHKISPPKIVETSTTVTRQITLFNELKKQITVADGDSMITVRKGKTRLKSFLAHHKSELAPPLQLLIYWGIQLLSKKVSPQEVRKAAAIKVSSLKRYWTPLGATLIRTMKLENPITMDPQELESCYEQIALKLHHSPYAIKRLSQFHSYLVAFYHIPKMEFNHLVDKHGQIIAKVDANLISPACFDKIVQSLGWGSTNLTRWQTLSLIATLLAYRCGLRPGEIRALKIHDIQGVTHYEAIIRKRKNWTPKSDAGVRRIPLSTLLSQEELDFLVMFHNVRKAEAEIFGDDFFLAHPDKKEGMVTDKYLFTPIRMIIRKVTRDQTLRFYHLRHSFLTWTNVSLLLNNRISRAGCSALDHPQFSDKKRSLLAKELSGNEFPNQKQQYTLAMIAGHTSPETSHKHYNHFSDWLLGYHLRTADTPSYVNHPAITAISKISRSQAFVLWRKSQQENVNFLDLAVRNQAIYFSDKLTHPALKHARRPRKTTLPMQKPSMPSWATIVTDNKNAPGKRGVELSKLSTKGWEIAKNIYSTVEHLDGRKLKGVKKIVQYATEHYSSRWHSTVYCEIAAAEKMVRFLSDCKIPANDLLLIHHPPRGQSAAEAHISAEKWRTSLKLLASQIVTGENANKKTTPDHGSVSLIVLEKPLQTNRKRFPRCSAGYFQALKLLEFNLF